MATSKDAAAFPYVTSAEVFPGMSKREYIAVMVASGMAFKPGKAKNVAKAATDLADALIEQLNEVESPCNE